MSQKGTFWKEINTLSQKMNSLMLSRRDKCLQGPREDTEGVTFRLWVSAIQGQDSNYLNIYL